MLLPTRHYLGHSYLASCRCITSAPLSPVQQEAPRPITLPCIVTNIYTRLGHVEKHPLEPAWPLIVAHPTFTCS